MFCRAFTFKFGLDWDNHGVNMTYCISMVFTKKKKPKPKLV